MAYQDDVDAFVPVEEEPEVERQLADRKVQDRTKASRNLSNTSVNPLGKLTDRFGNRTKSNGGGGKIPKMRRSSGGGGKVRKSVGTGAQLAGAGGQVAGKGVEMAGKGMKIAGKGVRQGGMAVMKAGTSLSGTGIGAIAGIPMIIAGGAMVGAGYGMQGAGTGLEAAGKAGGQAAKGVKEKGRAMKQGGGAGGLNIPGIGGAKTDKGDGFNLVGAAAGMANKATGGSPLSGGMAGAAVMAAVNFLKKIVGFGSKNLLRVAWILVPVTLGASLIYIIFHGIASYFLGRRMFCRLGEEWGMGNIASAPASMLAAGAGGAAGMAGAGSIGNLISAAPRAGKEMGEWMIVAILTCLAAAIWFMIIAIFIAVAQGIMVVVNAISSAWNYIANWVSSLI